MKTNELCMALSVALLAAAGCERGGAAPSASEGGAHARAMAEYSAGRLDKATEGFAAAVRENPADAEARFQLAVLLQDYKRDYIGALASYRDYSMLAPSSDKSPIAAERAAQCERLVAAEIAKKANLADVSGMMKELEETKAKLAAAEKNAAESGKALAEAKTRAATLEREIAGMRRTLALMREGPEETAGAAPRIVPGAGAAADDGGAASAALARPPAAAAGQDEERGPIVLNEEAKALFEEEEREAAAAGVGNGSSILPKNERWHVVGEGETLSEIAKKYYGRKSAWRKIQDANKTTVPQDGKVRAGDRLLIP